MGQRVDYLSPTVYVSDILAVLFISVWIFKKRDNFQFSIFNFQSNFNAKNVKKTVKLPLQSLLLKRANEDVSNVITCVMMLLFLSIGIFLSKNFLSGLYHLVKLFEFLLLGFAIKDFLSNDNQEKKPGIRNWVLLAPLMIGITFEGLLALWQFFQQSSVGGLFYFLGERSFNGDTPGIANASLNGQLILRPYATFSHPNVLAGYLVIAMTIVSSSKYSQKWTTFLEGSQGASIKKRILFILPLIVGTIALFFTLSRVAIILWVLIVGYKLVGAILIQQEGTKGSKEERGLHLSPLSLLTRIEQLGARPAPTIKFLVFLLCITSLIFIFPLLRYRFLFTLANESVTDRILLIQAAWKMTLTHLSFGVGFGNFLTELPFAIQSSSHHSVILLQPVHNFFLLIAAETGIPGLVFTLWFLWKTVQWNLQFPICNFQSVFKKLIFNDKLYLLTIVIVLGQFDHYFLTMQQGQLLLTLVLAICWSKKNI